MSESSWIIVDSAPSGEGIAQFIGWGCGKALDAAHLDAACSSAWVLRRVEHELVLGPAAPPASVIFQVRDDETSAVPAFLDGAPLDSRVTRRSLLSIFDASKESGQYWSMVRVDFVATDPNKAAQEAEFNHWYDYVHLPKLCSRPGIHRGWRTSLDLEVPGLEHYWMVYEIDAPNLVGSLKKVVQFSEPWRDNIRDQPWGRSYHEVVGRYSVL